MNTREYPHNAQESESASLPLVSLHDHGDWIMVTLSLRFTGYQFSTSGKTAIHAEFGSNALTLEPDRAVILRVPPNQAEQVAQRLYDMATDGSNLKREGGWR